LEKFYHAGVWNPHPCASAGLESTMTIVIISMGFARGLLFAEGIFLRTHVYCMMPVLVIP